MTRIASTRDVDRLQARLDAAAGDHGWHVVSIEEFGHVANLSRLRDRQVYAVATSTLRTVEGIRRKLAALDRTVDPLHLHLPDELDGL